MHAQQQSWMHASVRDRMKIGKRRKVDKKNRRYQIEQKEEKLTGRKKDLKVNTSL